MKNWLVNGENCPLLSYVKWPQLLQSDKQLEIKFPGFFKVGNHPVLIPVAPSISFSLQIPYFLHRHICPGRNANKNYFLFLPQLKQTKAPPSSVKTSGVKHVFTPKNYSLKLSETSQALRDEMRITRVSYKLIKQVWKKWKKRCTNFNFYFLYGGSVQSRPKPYIYFIVGQILGWLFHEIKHDDEVITPCRVQLELAR